MNKIRVHFSGVSEIVGSSDIGLLTLLNEDESLQLVITCDKQMMYQFALRMQHVTGVERLFPEVLWAVITTRTDLRFEVDITGLVEGEYQAVLVDPDAPDVYPMRASDAILLSVVGKLPVYVEEKLMKRQSVAYHPQSSGMSLPVNVISDQMLKSALDKAVKEEDYELASLLRDEMKRRKEKKESEGESNP